MLLHNVGPIFFRNICGWAFIRLDFLGNMLEKSTFLASKLGNGPLLEHGPLIEILRYPNMALLYTKGFFFNLRDSWPHKNYGKSF